MKKKEFTEKIIRALKDKKGEDTVAYDVKKLTTFTDIIIITTARSSAQINAILKELKKKVPERPPTHIEGDSSSGWVLADYGETVLNIFLPEMREFYGLERLWGDGKKINV